jgi:glycerol-3-phosphate dehydrogenase
MEVCMAKDYDVIIIGGGAVGCMVARYLSRYKLDILLIEKESDIGMGTSSANSAIMHAGYDALPGTFKAKTNAISAPLWDDLSRELGIPFSRCGDYVVATAPNQFETLDILRQQGLQNCVPELQIISAEELRAREPMVSPDALAALWVPSGGILDTFAVTVAAAENAVMNGVTVMLETPFVDFLWEGRRIIGVKAPGADYHARWVVNAAGLYADDVMHKAGVRPEFVIRPRRGEYVILDEADFNLTRQAVFFPTPTDKGKGIVVTSSMHGNTIVGPNSNFVDSKEDKTFTQAGFNEIWEGARKIIPGINRRNIIAQFAGLRAHGNAACLTPGVNYSGDFVIEIPAEVQGLVNLGGIESPGLTASPGIALMVIDLLKQAGEPLQKKPYWNPVRPARPVFRHLSKVEQAALVASDPGYGRIICRCETVTEGEILAEIHAPIPARTYDAIKRRTWTGTGRCQGGFDMPRVVKMLSDELGIPPEQVTKKGSGSPYLYRHTKDLEEAA